MQETDHKIKSFFAIIKTNRYNCYNKLKCNSQNTTGDAKVMIRLFGA